MIAKAYLFLGILAAAIGLFGFFYRYVEAGWTFGDWAGMAAFGNMPTASAVLRPASTWLPRR